MNILLARKQFEFTLQSLLESVNAKIDDASPDLKVKHSTTGFLYTVISVSKKDVILKTPEGKEFVVDAATFEKDYEV
jgi:hypothetical protein